jgi:hypothetical protein
VSCTLESNWVMHLATAVVEHSSDCCRCLSVYHYRSNPGAEVSCCLLQRHISVPSIPAAALFEKRGQHVRHERGVLVQQELR